ncbi:putative integral membrane protein [Acanthocheilonema viteae]
MDFDPQNQKWFCCCCHLSQGLMILASSEIILSILSLLYSIAYIAILNSGEKYDDTLWFIIILMSISIMYGVTSALLIIGIYKNKEKLMYPTLVARAIIVIFMQVFGVSTIVRPSYDVNDINWKKLDDQKIHKNLNGKKMEKETTAGQRLMMLIFIMMLISIFVFYTLYLIVRCIHYVKAYNRLLDRKRSLILACNIDPMNKRHYLVNSRHSQHNA